MLKKIVSTLTLSLAFSSVYASHQAMLTVAPNYPNGWAYQGAVVTIENNPPVSIGGGVSVPIAMNDHVKLEVWAFYFKATLSPSCENLTIPDENDHQLTFELGQDLEVYCHFN